MLKFMGWDEAATLIEQALEQALKSSNVTFDLAQNINNSTTLSCSDFAQKVIEYF